MHKIFIFCLLFSCNYSFSQITIKGDLIDAMSQKPLGYACIYIPLTQIGTYSDINGEFTLILDRYYDTITFSLIGYISTKIAVKDLNKSVNKVLLQPIDFKLPELTVKHKNKVITELIGYTKNKKNNVYTTGDMEGYLRAVFIPNKYMEDDVYIKNIVYIFCPSCQKDKAKIRVHLYRPNVYSTDKSPGEELLPESIIVNVNKTSKLVVDISKYAIKLPLEGVYVGLEWIEGQVSKEMYLQTWKAPVFRSTYDINFDYSWTTYMNNGIWKKSDFKKSDNFSNPMFGLTIIR